MKKTLAILLSLALVICMLPSVAFAAEPVALNATNVTLSQTIGIYNGSAIAPSVKVNVSGAKEGVDYTVTTSPSPMINAGTYTVTVAAKSESTLVEGSVDKTFTINKATIGNAIVTVKSGETLINATDFAPATVDGKTVYNLTEAAKKKISVKLGGVELEGEGLYTISGVIASPTATTANITVTCEGNDNFQASSKTISVNAYNELVADDSAVGGTVVEIPAASKKLTYTGNALNPSVTVKRINAISSTGTKTYTTLQKGTNYTVEYYDSSSTKVNEIKNVGIYSVVVVGAGTYTGNIVATDTIEVVGKAISGVSITAETAADGEMPVLTVKDGTRILTSDDYEITDYTPTKSPSETANGAGTVTIQGKGNYTGTKSATYTIVYAANKIQDATIALANKVTTINNKVYTGYYYNGQVQTPAITVKLGTKTLTTSDYKVEYSYTNVKGETVVTTAPKDAKSYIVTVTGRGSYAGSQVLSFQINKYPLSDAVVTVSQASATATPSVSVKTADGAATFAKDTDYTISGPYVTSSTNTATLYVYAATDGNLDGSKYVSYNIAPKALSACTIVADTTAKYTGSAIVPSVKVLDGTTTLYANSAYTVTYKDEKGTIVTSIKDAGTYTIVITGINGYTGSVTKTFTVQGNNLSNATITLNTTSIDATGYNVSLPAILSVKDGLISITEANYTKTYQDAAGKTITEASTPGTYYVVITGKGLYQGTAKVAFQIKGTDQVISVTSASLVKTYRNSDEFALGAACSTSKLTYTSSDSAIASVTSDGIVTPMGKAGTATITITAPAAGKYNAASATVTVVARPYKAKVTSVSSPAAGSLKAYVAKQSGCTGYQVVISKSSSFKKGTRFFKKIANNPKFTSSQSTTYTGLSAGKYYVKARAMYIGADGTVAYGNYGAVQTVTVK